MSLDHEAFNRLCNQGGPAYPSEVSIRPSDNTKPFTDIDFCGMTLRDYFAAAALQGVILLDYGLELGAMRAYEWADAMIAQRDKP